LEGYPRNLGCPKSVVLLNQQVVETTLKNIPTNFSHKCKALQLTFQVVYKLTLGLPREICKVTDMALLRAMVKQTHAVNAAIVRQTAEQLAVNEQEDTAAGDTPHKTSATAESQKKAGTKTTL